jgi:hypothetical protein
LALDVVALDVVKLGNSIEYFFVDVIPPYLNWFADNWTNVFKDAFTFTATIFENLASNIVKIMTNLPGLIRGSVHFGDLWTPLTDGFTKTMSDLPKIAARQEGTLETGLEIQINDIGEKLAKGLDNKITKNATNAKNAADVFGKGFSDGFKNHMKTDPLLPESRATLPVPVDVKQTAPVDLEISPKVKNPKEGGRAHANTMIRSGSGESSLATYLGGFQARLPRDEEEDMAAKGKTKITTPQTPGITAATPSAFDAAGDMDDEDEAGNPGGPPPAATGSLPALPPTPPAPPHPSNDAADKLAATLVELAKSATHIDNFWLQRLWDLLNSSSQGTASF